MIKQNVLQLYSYHWSSPLPEEVVIIDSCGFLLHSRTYSTSTSFANHYINSATTLRTCLHWRLNRNPQERSIQRAWRERKPWNHWLVKGLQITLIEMVLKTRTGDILFVKIHISLHMILINLFRIICNITCENAKKRVFVQVNRMKLKRKEEDKAWPLPCASSYFLGHFPIFF